MDTSIALKTMLPQIDSPFELQSKGLQLRALMSADQQNQYQQQQQQQAAADDQSYRQALQSSAGDNKALLSSLAGSGNYKGYAQAQKAALDAQKANADVAETNGKVAAQAFALHRDRINTVNTPQDAVQWVKEGFSDPAMAPILSRVGTPEQAIKNIPTDPEGFQRWKVQAGLAANEYVKHTSVDANTALNNKTQIANNTANNATSRANNAANNATSRANNADSNARMSSNSGGGMKADDTQTENIAQMIATGRMAPLGQMAMRSPAGVKIMSRVAELNPEFRAQTFATGSKAEKDFATGKQGNSVRSFNVALSHLDTLDQLSDALNNKDTQLINKIGNYYATQTGNPAPTNFEATKKIVADEIVKSIVGSGGGVADREEAAKTIQAANSPAQLKGVISSYKELMKGQIHGLQDQYKASTGRDDFDKYLSDNAKQYSSPSKPKATAPTKTQSGATVSNW